MFHYVQCSLVVLVSNPVGSSFRFLCLICLGYSVSNTLRGMTLPPALVSTFTQTEALVITITISWKVHNGLCFCFPGSFYVIDHDFTWITNHIRVRLDKVYIHFIILAIKFFHLNGVNMSLLFHVVFFAFLGCCVFHSFCGQGHLLCTLTPSSQCDHSCYIKTPVSDSWHIQVHGVWCNYYSGCLR